MKEPRKSIPGIRAFVGFMGVVGIVIIAWIFYSISKQQNEDEKTSEKPGSVTTTLPGYTMADTPRQASSNPVVETKVVDQQPSPEEKKGPTPEELLTVRRLGGTLSNSAKNTTESNGGGVSATGANGRSGASDESSALASRLTSAKIEAAVATKVLNPSMTVGSGVMIPCGTKTEMDTTHPGMVSCSVSRDVFSIDGRVRLIDKGAHVDGQLASGIKAGEKRVFVLWTKLRNPDGTVISLDSPGTNAVGSTGIPGEVDTHFWERFGNAMFVSVFTDIGSALVQTAANRSSNAQTSINLGTTSSTSDQLAKEVLQATINIPPTLFVPQGDAVSIYVARDLDFSSVYKLQIAK